MKNRLPPSAVTMSAWIHLKYDLTSARLQDAEVKWTFVICYVLLFFYKPALSCDLPVCSPSCITAKHLLFETQMSGALLPPKPNQRARLRYQIKLHAALLLCGATDQRSPLSNPYFIGALKLIS